MPCLASISVFLRDRLINYVLKFYANCKQVSKDLRLTHFQIPRKGYDEANSFRDGGIVEKSVTAVRKYFYDLRDRNPSCYSNIYY